MTDAPALALYYYETCWYCVRVQKAIAEFGLNVELRNIRSDRSHLEDLLAARGRRRVPVLRIQNGDDDTWIPESRTIITYLRELAGEPTEPGVGQRALKWLRR